MVPRLRGVVEQALVARTFRMVDDFLERLRREIGALDRGVGLVDIGLVMLAMMRRQRVGRDMRRKCVLGIRQGRMGDRHGSLLFYEFGPLTRYRVAELQAREGEIFGLSSPSPSGEGLGWGPSALRKADRSEEHTSELQSLMRIS